MPSWCSIVACRSWTVHDVLDGGIAQLVGRAVDEAAANAAAGQPDGHRLVVVVAAVAPLRHRRAAELAGPDDQRVVEHAALLQVGDQRHAGPVDLLGLERDAFLHAAVMVPVLVVKLDEAHAALGQPAGEQAIGGERAIARLAAVEFERLLRLSPRTSISSGTLACIWNAISYWAMRVATSGSCDQRVVLAR